MKQKRVINLSPKLKLRPAWQELDDKGANENFINSIKPPQENKIQLKRGYSKLEFYQEDGLTVYKSADCNLKLQGKGWSLLDLLSLNKNTPYSIEDIRKKCNPNITITKHHFKKIKDIEDTINHIRRKLKVSKSEYFPILKREGYWIWAEN